MMSLTTMTATSALMHLDTPDRRPTAVATTPAPDRAQRRAVVLWTSALFAFGALCSAVAGVTGSAAMRAAERAGAQAQGVEKEMPRFPGRA